MSEPSPSQSEARKTESARLLSGCPLCGERVSQLVQSIRTRQLIEAWKAVGVTFSDGVPREVEGKDELQLRRCVGCGFEYSDLECAGGADFYKQLQQQLPNYYPPESAEYPRAIEFARAHGVNEALDVGCGSGAFLNLARKAGLKTFGVELNPEAVAAARKAGHQIYNELLSEIIARGEKRKFELVTTWQVLEHVPDPVGFLTDCATFVKRGGYLAVAVPTEDGINSLAPFNPHVWPPHHVTRWRLKDLRRIGEKVGLRFYRGGNDPFNPYQARHMWDLHNQLASIFNERPRPGGRLLPKVGAALAARVGVGKLMPDWGHSTYAFFQAS